MTRTAILYVSGVPDEVSAKELAVLMQPLEGPISDVVVSEFPPREKA